MTAPKVLTGLSRERQVALVCAGVLLIAILGYFVVVSPKRSTAHKLSAERAQVEEQIARNRASALGRNLPTIRAADIFRLTKAMPSDTGMPDLILELNQLASDSGISFDAIEPQPPTSDNSYDIHPISLTFSGNFYSLADFLFRVRNLVRVHDQKFVAKGRMLALSGLTFSEGENKFPQIQAELTVDSFVLGSATATGPTGTATSGSEGSSSSSSSSSSGSTPTTTTTTTTSESASASAAPSSSLGR
jgi:Tfp pilus assembly protein PilO